MAWRAVVSFKDGSKQIGQNFDSKDEADIWVLEQAEKSDIKISIVADKEDLSTKEITHF